MELILSGMWVGEKRFKIDEVAYAAILRYCREHRRSCILVEEEK